MSILHSVHLFLFILSYFCAIFLNLVPLFHFTSLLTFVSSFDLTDIKTENSQQCGTCMSNAKKLKITSRSFLFFSFSFSFPPHCLSLSLSPCASTSASVHECFCYVFEIKKRAHLDHVT